ncbi:MAG TPA: AAA family ATPase [Catenuloplanes sp.]|jgi:predicted ATPase
MSCSVVGRDRALGELVGLLAAARAGAGTLALLTGEAGIGKSTLADALAAAARAQGVPVLLGRAVAEEGAPAYWPWRRALESALTGLSPALVDADAHAQQGLDPPGAVRFRATARIDRYALRVGIRGVVARYLDAQIDVLAIAAGTAAG